MVISGPGADAIIKTSPNSYDITIRLCIVAGMSRAAPILRPRQRKAGGCCIAAVEPDLAEDEALELAGVLKALADPTRLRIVDAVRKAAPEAICQCEFLPLFDMTQAAVSKHLKVLVTAGVLDSERRGTWTYYYMRAGALEELTSWLT